MARISFVLLFVTVLGSSTINAANYAVTFEAAWSEETHPNAYPGASAHFSPSVGVIHNSSVGFWAPGQAASRGIENVAETGSTSALNSEIAAVVSAGNALGVIQGSNFDSPGSQSYQFEAVADFPLFTHISMIAPSPDWFVGVHDLELLNEDGWVSEIVVDLRPYDAGTEDGNRFSINNSASSPLGVIERIDDNADSVLFESASFGTLRIELLPLCDLNLDQVCDANDLNSTDGLYSVGDLNPGVEVVNGENSQFDLNADNRVDTADLDFWLANAAEQNGFAEPYLRGDTNLNDHVGFGDFTVLSTLFGQGREWTEGNYDGTGVVEFSDFLSLSRNFGLSIARQPAPASVPEPAGGSMFGLAMVAALALRRRTRMA